MLLPGYYYQLTVIRKTHQGAWLDAAGTEILLPLKECPVNIGDGEKLTVFLYLDRHQKLCATRDKPSAQVGEFALLTVKNTTLQGAFLDWGLAKDLLLPCAEQLEPMQVGRRYLVRICHDDQQRPIASARLEKYLREENCDLSRGDEVDLIVWQFTDLGAKVIVNHLYTGVIYRDDLLPGMKRGDKRIGYVAKIRDDGKLDISLQPAGTAGIDLACTMLLKQLEQQDLLPLTDASPPEMIRSRLGISKKLFKKAVGSLYKEGKITLTPEGIRRS
ncbi:S1 RNA-binding domain-containing protein [Pelovirga terrestris]|uniref:GntR family transcriptional regulator n=1 Tax=Pelovirga terrestris TaxID=2771352 RepID=A0A8J6QRW6_9BACT|nr:S1-like domain-containing RNA-binding protein [Pelovirga terrestris]MBD1401198.1 GntR family transcriptional regulator [Pelovirga terrestris]